MQITAKIAKQFRQALPNTTEMCEDQFLGQQKTEYPILSNNNTTLWNPQPPGQAGNEKTQEWISDM